jgi:hypothetical protein
MNVGAANSIRPAILISSRLGLGRLRLILTLAEPG